MAENIEDSRRYTYQTSVICDGCEGIRDVHHFCLDCHGNLCNRCKERHPKVKLTRNHKVLPRGHPSVIKARIAKTKRKIPSCRKHADNDYITYCIKCNVPCCAMCMIENHAGHDVTEFDNVEKDVSNALTQYGENLEKEVLPQAQKITTELQQRKSRSRQQMEKNKEQVRQRVSGLQKKLSDLGKEAEDKLDEMHTIEMKALDDLITTSEIKSKVISDLVDRCKQTNEKTNTVKMSLLLSDSPAELATLLPKVSLPPSTIFTVSEYDTPNYLEVIGKVEEDIRRKTLFDPESSNIKLTKPEIKQELSAPESRPLASLPDVKEFSPDMIQANKDGEFSTSITPNSMVMTDDDDVWIRQDRTLALYDGDGNQKHTMTMTFDINDITLTTSQDIIATDSTNERIVRISSSGDVTSLCSTSPLCPDGICINGRQQLVVGLSEVYGAQQINLVVYSSDGGVVQEMEKDGEGKSLFKYYIHRVRQNVNGDYVVIDDDTLVCLTRDGSLRWRQNRIDLRCIECDRYCNVFHCDREGVTMLDRDGGLIRQLLTSEKDGIVGPRSISLDRQGKLWIGIYGESIQIWKYLK